MYTKTCMYNRCFFLFFKFIGPLNQWRRKLIENEGGGVEGYMPPPPRSDALTVNLGIINNKHDKGTNN